MSQPLPDPPEILDMNDFPALRENEQAKDIPKRFIFEKRSVLLIKKYLGIYFSFFILKFALPRSGSARGKIQKCI